MLIYGHRGAAGLAPENTIESIRTALALGVDGVEFDFNDSPVMLLTLPAKADESGSPRVGFALL